MSADAADGGLLGGRRLASLDDAGLRIAALAGVAALTYSYTSVLYRVTDVVGAAGPLVVVVGATVALSAILGRYVRLQTAFALTLLFVGGGFAVYVLSIPSNQLAFLSVERIVSDTTALLTGLSVLRLTAADVWALATAPGPVFLSWYLAIRRRYVLSVVAGGGALGLFVLTGDADAVTTLVGVVGGTAAVGLGTLDRHGASAAQLDGLVVVLAAMVVLSASFSVIPGGGSATPLVPDRGSPTMEASLVNADDSVDVRGSIRLSPKVRFTVESEESTYWQVGAYDRYTGDGWVRTGDTRPYDGQLSGPPGDTRSVEQTVTAKTRLSILPAAWKPVEVSDPVSRTAVVTTQGTLRPGTTIRPDEEYTVESRVPRSTRDELRRAGTDYPNGVRSNYLQLPSSTSERVEQRAAEVAGDEGNAYDKAVAVEEYLEENKRYSLSVERPEGDVAESFLFEMDAGYCVYYATTMVVMLRSQGVPARFATGYTPGEQVDDDRWVVRGLNSHAWVEVYFPDTGWVRFDPTPSGPRESARQDRLTEARNSGEGGVDTNETRPETTTPERGTVDDDGTTPTAAIDGSDETVTDRGTPPAPGGDTDDTPGGGDGAGGDGGFLPDPPPRRTLAVGLVALAGLAAGARRTGAAERAYRAVWVRYRGSRRDPEADVARAFERLEYLLSRRYRARRPGETPRRYLQALSGRGLDRRALAVGQAYERAQYGRGVSREESDEAVDAVDALAWESTPLVGRLWRRGDGGGRGGGDADASGGA